MQNIKTKPEIQFSTNSWAKVSEEGKDLVARLLVKDPESRMSAQEALQHPWMIKQSAYF